VEIQNILRIDDEVKKKIDDLLSTTGLSENSLIDNIIEKK